MSGYTATAPSLASENRDTSSEASSPAILHHCSLAFAPRDSTNPTFQTACFSTKKYSILLTGRLSTMCCRCSVACHGSVIGSRCRNLPKLGLYMFVPLSSRPGHASPSRRLQKARCSGTPAPFLIARGKNTIFEHEIVRLERLPSSPTVVIRRSVNPHFAPKC